MLFLLHQTRLRHADVTLSVLIDTNPESIASFDAVSKAYMEKHPDVTFDVEQRAGGSEGDNIIKTRLATGEMADIFQYNSGSLFQALKPQETIADLSDLPSEAGILDSFKKVVTSPDGHVRGLPFGPAMEPVATGEPTIRALTEPSASFRTQPVKPSCRA